MRESSDPPRDPPGGGRCGEQTAHRRLGLLFSVLTALALHGLALAVFVGAIPELQMPHSDAKSGVPLPSTVTVLPVTPSSARGAGLVVGARAQIKASAERPLEPIVQAAAAMQKPGGGSAAVRFYRFNEVDMAAEPDSDWNLDTAALDAFGLNRLVFQVFVSRSGEPVHCMILEPTTLAVGMRESLEQRLCQTVLRPALRAGEPVASVRRIEIRSSDAGSP